MDNRIRSIAFRYEGAAFLKDTLRWKLVLLKGKIAKKYFRIPITQLVGPPPTGTITVEPLKVSRIEAIPLGTMVFIYGPNDLDLRFWSYTFCNSHPTGYACLHFFYLPRVDITEFRQHK